jgi:hypothetical protein
MMKKIFKNLGIFNQKNNIGSKTGGGLRLKIIIVFIVFFIIVIFYHTYFEETTKDDIEQLPQLVKSKKTNIFKDYTNKSDRLYNPTIAMQSPDHYLIAFEKLGKNGSINIWFTNSLNGIDWSKPKLLFDNLSNTKMPYLEYIKDKFYVLSFLYNNSRYITTSINGDSWITPHPSELYYKNKSLYYGDDYFLMANSTGLWRVIYEDLKTGNIPLIGEQILSDNLSNASISYVNKYKFNIIHENPIDGFSSINLTTILFEPLEKNDNEVKWDLLIVFVILGFVFLVIIIQEVARD